MSAYADLLDEVGDSVVGVDEAAPLILPDELKLQAFWFAGQMGRDFTAVDGSVVKIVQFGHWNHSAGPDFLHAVVEIAGVRHSGAIEIEHRFSDWEAHGHAVNESFNGVILHVVFCDDGRSHFTRTSDQRQVPQVVVPESVLRDALDLPLVAQANAHPGRCFEPLAQMDVADLDALMMAAARHRAGSKARRKRRTVAALDEDEWLWQVLAETLGYRPNRLAMMLLAQRLPIHDLASMDEEMESVIFGASGFLSAEIYEQSAAESRGYLRELWENWWRLRGDYEPVPERAIPWTFSGVRPVNHPQRRLSCLVEVAKRWPEFKQACRTTCGVDDFFKDLDHPYWSYHYTVKSKISQRKLALIGGARIRDFQINHLLPERLAADDHVAWERYLKMPAPSLSEKVDKASVRLFGADDGGRRKTYLRKAWQHQALLQIYQDFCLRDLSDCHDCPFPEQLAQWRG